MNTLDVRIVTLDPMRVASMLGFGPAPRPQPGRSLSSGLDRGGLALAGSDRPLIFGFNNPSPTPASPNYGYEFWMRPAPRCRPMPRSRSSSSAAACTQSPAARASRPSPTPEKAVGGLAGCQSVPPGPSSVAGGAHHHSRWCARRTDPDLYAPIAR